jgi:hypothetical protein
MYLLNLKSAVFPNLGKGARRIFLFPFIPILALTQIKKQNFCPYFGADF